MRSELYNGGAYCRTARGTGNNAVTAGGSGDAVEVSSLWQAREGDKGIAMSAKLIISYTATLAVGETLSFAGNFQDDVAGDGNAAADYGEAFPETIVATGETGGSTETGTVEIDIDLASARGYIRAQVTPNLSRGATDTAAWHMDLVFFGDHHQPSTKAIASL